MAAGQVREQTAQTAYDGQEITYDGIGNPLSYRGWTMSWQGGRQLATMTGSSKSLSFDYGESGLRLGKTCTVDDSSTVHTYTWNGSLLSSDICGNTALYFHYDTSGSPMGFTLVNSEGSTGYFYVKNLQGDILKVIDAAGTVHASYTYDAWGNILSSSGDLADVNPLRYRGYYYDSETGLYYLQSRYYDPEVGRFINADGYASTGQGILGNNMFAYCLNNPVNYSDPDGFMPKWLEEYINNAKDAVQGLKNTLIKKKQKQYNGTLVVGLNYSLGYGAGAGGSLGIGMDNNGNIGLVAGNSIGGAMPTVSVTGFISVSNASSLNVLEGKSFLVGASCGEGAVFGGEMTIMPDAAKGNTSTAGTAQLGFGVGIPFELHGEYAHGYVSSFNIYDVLIAGCDYILGGKK